jgi:hypothetical protein
VSGVTAWFGVPAHPPKFGEVANKANMSIRLIGPTVLMHTLLRSPTPP